MTADTQQRILDAVDANFDAQLATTKDFVASRAAKPECRAQASLRPKTRQIRM